MLDAATDCHILVVCQAGAQTGLGHLSRALAISRALHQSGFKPELLVQSEKISLTEAASIPITFYADSDLTAALRSVTAVTKPKLIIFDLQPQRIPATISTLLAELRATGSKLITIDAMSELHELFDIVFLPTFLLKAELTEIAQRPENKTKFVYGWDCFLLKVATKTKVWQDGSAVLALTGGSDVTELGQHWPERLADTLSSNTHLHWVTGPYAKPPKLPQPARLVIHEHKAPENLHGLMSQINYAITVYGISFYELLYYGVPTVVFSPYGDKDSAELNAIAASGVAVVAENEIDATEKLKHLMASPDIAAALASNATKLMALPGEYKLVDIILQLLDPSCKKAM